MTDFGAKVWIPYIVSRYTYYRIFVMLTCAHSQVDPSSNFCYSQSAVTKAPFLLTRPGSL